MLWTFIWNIDMKAALFSYFMVVSWPWAWKCIRLISIITFWWAVSLQDFNLDLKSSEGRQYAAKTRYQSSFSVLLVRVGLMALRAQEKLVAHEESLHKVCVWETVWMYKEKTQSQCNGVHTVCMCVRVKSSPGWFHHCHSMNQYFCFQV